MPGQRRRPAVPPLLRFFFIDAVWSGTDREACLATPEHPTVGACWAFVRVWFSYFVYGFYPAGQRWRVDLFFLALAFGIVWLLRLSAPRRDIAAFYFFIVLPANSLMARLKGPVPEAPPATKACPECLSDIPVAARRCAHCAQPVV